MNLKWNLLKIKENISLPLNLLKRNCKLRNKMCYNKTWSVAKRKMIDYNNKKLLMNYN